LVGAYFEEAKWASKGYMPTLEEYLHKLVTSSGTPMLTCTSFIIMEEKVTEDVLDSVICVPKTVEASALMETICMLWYQLLETICMLWYKLLWMTLRQIVVVAQRKQHRIDEQREEEKKIFQNKESQHTI